MLVAWMVYSLGVSALLALAASGAEWIMRGARGPVRFVWASAMVLAITLGVTAPFRTQIASPVPSNTVESSTDRVSDGITPTGGATTMAPVTALRVANSIGFKRNDVTRSIDALRAPLRSAVDIVVRVSPTVTRAVSIAWLTVSLCLLVAASAMYGRFAALRQRWPRQLLLGQSVRVSANVGPAAIGIFPSEIVIPRWVLARDIVQQRLVLAHEQEHVRAYDPLLLIAGCVAAMLAPWNVALWYMWSRLRLAVELDCDQRVLAFGASKPQYGTLLVDLSAPRPAGMSFTPALAFGRSHLEARLLAMTERRTNKNRTQRAVAALTVAALLTVACESKLPDTTTQQGRVSKSDTTVTSPKVPRQFPGRTTAGHNDHIHVVIDGSGARNVVDPVREALDHSGAARTLYSYNPTTLRDILTAGYYSFRALNSKNTSDEFLIRGLVVLNGQTVDARDVNSISLRDIDSLVVMTGKVAESKFSDPTAKNGVTEIFTRQ